MELIIFISGMVIGLFLGIIVIISIYFFLNKTPLLTKIKQVDSKLKKKGTVFEVGEAEQQLDNWVDGLKQE